MKEQGFNLLELCIAMSIVMILSWSTSSAYHHHQQNLARKKANFDLQDIALSLEAHRDEQKGYSQLSLSNLGFQAQMDDYQFNLSAQKDTFLIQATPLSKDLCGTLRLDESGTLSSLC